MAKKRRTTTPPEGVQFIVRTKPEPGGSKRALPYRGTKSKRKMVVVDTNPKVHAYRLAVANECRKVLPQPYTGPVFACFTFLLRRPRSHFTTDARDRLRKDAPLRPTVRPDLIKFCRSTEDALNGVAWIDDSQNVAFTAVKRYARHNAVLITLTPLPDHERPRLDFLLGERPDQLVHFREYL